MKHQNLVFWLLTAGVFFALLLPKMIQEGMFMDGMLYAIVSKNQAHGFGTFWFPRFNQIGFAGIATFHEHPPLVFGLQSVFFTVFGDSYYVEKFYSFLMACLVAFLIATIWRLTFKESQNYKKMAWLPVLLWIIMPVVYFSFQNNLMENTMSVFNLLATYAAVYGLSQKKHLIPSLVLTGFFTFLASFSKGVPGFYTIGLAGIWWLVYRDISFRKMLLYSLILLGIPLLFYFLLVTINVEARQSLEFYVVNRLAGRIEDAPTVTNRFHILEKLFVETLPSILFLFLVILLYGFRRYQENFDRVLGKKSLLFILIGFSGSVPLMLTLVQKSFYFVHALPFYAMGLAILSAPVINGIIKKACRPVVLRISLFLSAFILVAVLIFSGMQAGKVERDQELLEDVHRLGRLIPSGSIIGIAPEMNRNWSLQMYLMRYYEITLDPGSSNHAVMLYDKHLKPPGKGFSASGKLALNGFTLYEKTDTGN